MEAMTSSEALRDIADRYWEARLEASPLFATFLGDHRFDDRVDDLSADADARQRTIWAGFAAEARAIDPTGLDATDRVTRQLLIEELDDATSSIDARFIELASDQMQGIHAELLTMAGQLRAAEPEHAAMAVLRVRAMGTMLDQAADRYRAGLAAGRTPARTCIDRSINQIDGYLGSPLDQDPFVHLAGPEGWAGEAAWRDELRDAVVAGAPEGAVDSDAALLSAIGSAGNTAYRFKQQKRGTGYGMETAGAHGVWPGPGGYGSGMRRR